MGRGQGFSPPDQILSLDAELDVVGEVERLAPIDNLAVRVVAVLGAERRPADQALEHDGAQRPPVAVERVAVPGEDLGRDVVGGSDGRVGHQPPRAPPVVDLGPVADRQVDLVDGDRVAVVARLVGLSLEELLVVVVVVQLVEAGRQAEIRQLDVAAPVEEDVVWFDISAALLA